MPLVIQLISSKFQIPVLIQYIADEVTHFWGQASKNTLSLMEVADYSSLVRNLLKHLLSYPLLKVQQKQHCDFLVTTKSDKF